MTDQTAGTGETQTTQATETNAADTTSTQTSETTTQATQATETTDANKPWIADNWREKIAGDDQKALARLQRFPDVGSVFKSFRELEGKLSSGQFKQPLPENPSPEQLAEYRQANGIPEKASDYNIELSDGLVIGEADRPLIDGILEAAHAVNASPQVVNAIVDEYYHMREEMVAAAQAKDEADKATFVETLRGELGGNFRSEMVAINNLIQMAPDGVGDLIMTARLADGSVLGNNIQVAKWLSGIARELNPAGTVVPNSGGDQLGSIKDQIAEMEGNMRKDIRAWQHPSNEGNRTRYRELIEARDKLTARGH